MKLRYQLILAFVLFAVVPLAGITIYNYQTSTKAYRQAVEEEANELTQEMGGHMETVRADMNRRLERLGSFPFRQLMELNQQNSPPEERRQLMQKLMSEMGDSAAFIDSLEFVPGMNPPPKPGSVPGHRVGPGRGGRGPRPPDSAGPPPAQADGSQRMILQIPLDLRDPGNRQIKPAAGVADASATAGKETTIYVEEVEKSAGTPQGGLPPTKESPDPGALRKSADAPTLPVPPPRGFDVLAQGDLGSQLTARVRPTQVFRSVLSRGRRRPNDIPFAIDAEGKLHTQDPADQEKLAALALTPSDAGVKTETRETARRDWVVATRKDANSKLTLGVARPIGEALLQIRHTSVRNLCYGLGMVGLALMGILPLSGKMTRNLAVLADGAERLAKGNLAARVPVKTKDEFGKLAETFNRMAQELGEHEKRLIEQERIRGELEMGRKIQEELLPRHPFRSGFVEAQGISIPAREVGGDFFNCFALPGGEVALLVGDVSGKGVGAALLMANLHATLQARLPLGTSLSELACQLDQEIAASTPPEAYLAVFMAILDERKGILRYVNAGHNTQFALRLNGSIDPMESTGRPLGLLPGGTYVERSIPLTAGDSLFLYTDGLVEAENSEGEEFGLERLHSILIELRSSKIPQVLSSIEERVKDFRGTVELSDDATMMVLRIGPTEVL
jgi:serine phosphatase RsbU (regulator of sigma subunit)